MEVEGHIFPMKARPSHLDSQGGKKWQARFQIREDNGGYYLDGEWLEFVCDNHLHEEDICVLQPIGKAEGRSTVMVHLLLKARSTRRFICGDDTLRSNNGDGTRKKGTPTSCVKARSVDGTSGGSNRSGYVVLGDNTRLTLPQEKIVVEKVKAIHSEAPIYVAVIDKSSRLSLDLGSTGRAAAADGHIPEGNQPLTLRQAGWSKAWRVEVRDGRRLPGGGWREFAADNRLQAGDLCLLEPVKDQMLAMAVHIIGLEQYC